MQAPSISAALSGPSAARHLLILPAAAVIGFLCVGIGLLAAAALGDNAKELLSVLARPDYRATLLRTHVFAGLVTVVSIFVSYPLAAAIHKAQRLRTTMLLLVILPWLVSIVVRTFGWMIVLGPNGFANQALTAIGLISQPLPLMFNPFGVIVGLVHVLMPFMVLSILSVLLQIPASMQEASMSLGAGPTKTFFRVTLPLTAPSIVSGSILVYLSAMGAVITPLLVGGLREKMVGTQIYTDVFTFFDFEKASALAFVLMASALLVVLPLLLLERWVVRATSETGRSR